MKITEALRAEHVVFHNLFDHIERAAPKLKTLGEVQAMACLLDAMLAAHSHTEDQLMIEPLEHCFEQIGQRDTFHQEHEQIEQNLELAQEARRLRTAREYLLEAVIWSRKHFDKEERLVFPLAEKVLNARTLLALGKTWMERREARIER